MDQSCHTYIRFAVVIDYAGAILKLSAQCASGYGLNRQYDMNEKVSRWGIQWRERKG